MAYMSQEMKKEIVAAAKPIMKKYGVKATYAVRHHSTIVVTIKSGALNIVEDYDFANNQYLNENEPHVDVNPYHFKNHTTGKTREFLKELLPIINMMNYDNSDPYTDYFDVGYYVDVRFGRWSKPYEYTA